jgi:conjugative transfer signal peptidase TraF
MASTQNHYVNFVKVGSGALAVLSLACITASHLGYRINSTPSMPEGIWKVDPITGPIRRGQIVSICPVDSTIFQTARSRNYLSWGLCQGGYSSLLKPVAAVPEDRLTISRQGISVNGVTAANSRSMAKDSLGRPMTQMQAGCYTVKLGTVWLVSSHPESFDSRYFGPLPCANILGEAKPIWIGGAVR